MHKRPDRNRQEFIKRLLTLLFFAGLILQVYALVLYGKTIIGWHVATTLYCITGLISQRLVAGILRNCYNTKSYFMQLFYCLCSFGGVVACCFLGANYFIPAGLPEEQLRLPIEEKGRLTNQKGRCKSPYVEVTAYDIKKQITFSCDYDVEKYSFLRLTTRKGLFGYYIITGKELE